MSSKNRSIVRSGLATKSPGRFFAFGLVSLVVFVSVFGIGWAQNSEIRGTVADEKKAMIPGAEIVVTQVATGTSRSTITNDVGFYSVPLLKEGEYQVKCSMPGFAAQQARIRLEVGQTSEIDFKLKVGEVTQVIEVQASAERLQSRAQDVGQVIDQKRIESLPLNGRNYLELAQLSVGVVKSVQGGRGENTGAEGGVRASGLSSSQQNLVLDGVDNSSRVGQGPLLTQTQAVKPPIEAISEFKVLTNNVSAEYGFRMGAKVLVSTRSGTNDLHGSLYEFHRNAATAANNFFFNSLRNPGATGQKSPAYIRNQFGATLGGPIIRDKTFFFGSYQGTRIREDGDSFQRGVPSLAVRSGDFSREPGGIRRNSKIFDPLTLKGAGAQAIRTVEFANNILPRERWDPIAAKLIELYPLPNCLTAGCENTTLNYFSLARNSTNFDQYDVRIDHNFSDVNRIFGRYSMRDEHTVRGADLPFPAAPGTTVDLNNVQNLALNHSYTLNPRTHNEFKFGWTWLPTLRGDLHTEDLNPKYGIKGAPSETGPDDEFKPGLAIFSIGGFQSLGGISPGGKLRNNQETFHIADNFLMDRGKHGLKFGVEYRTTTLDRLQGGGYNGSWGFSGFYTSQSPNNANSRTATGNGMADFLLGWVQNQNAGLVLGEKIAAPYWGLYVQDDWRVTSKLTVNLGVRWELFDGPYYPDSQNQLVSIFSMSGNWADETDEILPVQFTGWVFPKDDHDCGCERDLNNWSPRLGIAYRLTGNTVIRAGGGLFFGENDYLAYEAARYQVGAPKAPGNTGNIVSGNETTTLFMKDGFKPLGSGFAAGIIAPPGGTVAPVFIEPYLPNLTTGQWFLDVQHQLPGDLLLTLGYNGSASSHLSWWRVVSAPLTPHAYLLWTQRPRFPKPADPTKEGSVQQLQVRSNILNANYQAATARLEKRWGKGLTFLNSFTWAKSMDYGRSTTNAATELQSSAGFVSAFIKDLPLNYGRSDLDRTLAYSLSFLYDLPAGKGRQWLHSGPLSWILGGWQVGGILSMQSGPPLTHTVTPDTQNNTGGYRGDRVGNANLPESDRTVDRWFNTGFVIPGTPGTYGNAGRGLIDGPGWKNFDFQASKDFPMLREGHTLQFRFEAFNFTNTTHFGPPNLTIGNQNVGKITVADAPRIIQFALKYKF